jgi:hypothetical protein
MSTRSTRLGSIAGIALWLAGSLLAACGDDDTAPSDDPFAGSGGLGSGSGATSGGSGSGATSGGSGSGAAGSGSVQTGGSGGSRAGTGGSSGSSSAGSGARGGSGGTGGSSGSMSSGQPIMCDEGDCTAQCDAQRNCTVTCAGACEWDSPRNQDDPIPMVTATCNGSCVGECDEEVGVCNVTCASDCEIECQATTCNIMCSGADATLCSDDETYVCGAADCPGDDDMDAGR